MGQGISLTALSAGSAGINVKEFEDLSYEKSLGTARFMKCIRARHRHGLVVVKVAVRPYPDFKYGKYMEAVRRERDLLDNVPNALGYQRVLETESNGYLVRQYLHSSLYDRMSTRPFLEDIEKKWLSFQLLCALRDSHARNVYHGDIKSENILVTSWNWLFLTDFSSSFKKTYLPEDNPADFSYFFDTSGRRTCYLAPERFLGPSEEGDTRGVTWAMDIFSVGCVIAELFLESPIFSLSQLFKYRRGEYDPELGPLSKIEDRDIRELIVHMIQLEPESRYSAEEYLNFWRRKAFPEYFYSFLHQYMGLITDPSAGRSTVIPDTNNFGEADDRIDRMYYDFDKISYFLGYDSDRKSSEFSASHNNSQGEILPVEIDIPNNRHTASSAGRRPVDDGTLIFLTLVVSSLRNTARSTARLRACDLLLAFGERITDESKLDRILPFVVALLNDKADIVKIAALRTITQLMSLITVVSPVNAYVFTEYIRPRLQAMIQGPATKVRPAVRATYASCLSSLAHTSLRILDRVQALRADGSIPNIDPEAEGGVATTTAYQNLYDVARFDLMEHFELHTKTLLTDSDATVRRAFLGSVSSLCVFFGSSEANDVILSHLNTYLNDRDWMLKCSFFQTIVGVATFVGSASLEDFILPLMIQALTDPEEFVVEKVLSSFASMAELGLFQRSKTWEMVDVVARFMIHPDVWIREAASHYISAATRFLSQPDIQCMILPLVKPYLKADAIEFSAPILLDALKRPLSRPVFEMASTWATKAERGIFWKPIQQQRTFSFAGPDQTVPTISSRELTPGALRKFPKNEEDDQWLTRLRNLGMGADDEFKLLALKDYIGRMAQRRPREAAGNESSRLNGIVKLKELEVTPLTVFFETHRKSRTTILQASSSDIHWSSGRRTPRTITDALMDASTNIDDPQTSRKKSHVSSRKERHDGELAALPIPSGVQEGWRGASNSPSSLSSSPGVGATFRDSARPPTAPSTRASSRTQTRTEIINDNRSDDTLTPIGSLEGGPSRDRNTVKHKPSAISLLNRRETPKTIADTSTDATNATGEIDGIFSHEAATEIAPINERTNRKSSPMAVVEADHTYGGNDPNILKMLNGLASDNYPSDLMDFGPNVLPISRRLLRQSDTSEADTPWRPRGIHVATFSEHAGPINRILASPDHLFFITASDDGTVKVWDTLRLERNLIHRSRQTYKQNENAKVLTIVFIENTHTFISCATDGSVHAVKVDCTLVGDTTKYGKLRLVREHRLQDYEYAIWCDHFKADAKSVLIVATNTSQIRTFDLRTMTNLYTFSNPLHHGAVTTFCIDKKHNWLLLGTSHGVLDLWDLRFHLHLKSWGLAGITPIHRLQIHPHRGRGRWVCVAGGTSNSDITVWDIEKAQCREAYQANAYLTKITTIPSNNREFLKAYEPLKVDDETPETMLARFATALPPANTAVPDPGIRSMVIGTDTPDDGREAKYAFALTSGPDRKLRFWDLTRVEASILISGLDIDEPQPKYTVTHPTTSLIVNTEKPHQPHPISSAGPPIATNAGTGEHKTKSNSGVKRAGTRQPRSAVISRLQQHLTRSHLDEILDIEVLGRPVGMVISVDRKGCIYVFQ